MNKIDFETEKRIALQTGGEVRDFLTMRQAVEAWGGLPAAQRQKAQIILLGKDGRILQAADIERLDLGSAKLTIPLEELNAENDE